MDCLVNLVKLVTIYRGMTDDLLGFTRFTVATRLVTSACVDTVKLVKPTKELEACGIRTADESAYQ